MRGGELDKRASRSDCYHAKLMRTGERYKRVSQEIRTGQESSRKAEHMWCQHMIASSNLLPSLRGRGMLNSDKLARVA